MCNAHMLQLLIFIEVTVDLWTKLRSMVKYLLLHWARPAVLHPCPELCTFTYI